MTINELKSGLESIDSEANKKKTELIKNYCQEHNPYNVGDIFTDHIGSITIEKILYDTSFILKNPCCVYYGTELKKDMTPVKNKNKRQAWQSNDINKK